MDDVSTAIIAQMKSDPSLLIVKEEKDHYLKKDEITLTRVCGKKVRIMLTEGVIKKTKGTRIEYKLTD